MVPEGRMSQEGSASQRASNESSRDDSSIASVGSGSTGGRSIGNGRVTIVIRLSGGDVDYRTETVSDTTLADLRHAVRADRGGTTLNRRLRFVYNGHLLSDSTNIARDVVGSRSKVYVHCFVGPIMSAEELAQGEANEAPQETSTTPQARGFDRLRAAGFDDEEIAALREQFGELYGTQGGSTELQELEEQWIDNEAGAPSSSTQYLSDVSSVLVGGFAGIFVMALIKMGGFTRRQINLALAGAAINVSFFILQAMV